MTLVEPSKPRGRFNEEPEAAAIVERFSRRADIGGSADRFLSDAND